MSSNERIRRPPLERTQPIRNWSALFGPPSPGSPPPDGADPTRGRQRGGGLGDVVSRSVELGYRVIDEYIRQGQKAARRLSEGAYGPERWAEDAQDLAQRMAQVASELVGTWFELLERANAGSAARPTPPAPGARPAQPTTAAVPGGYVRLAIASAQPLEVLLELRPEAAGRRLVAHALRAPEAWKPRLDEVEFRVDGAGGAPTLHIRVPAHHPPGSYEGLVVDEDTSRPVGVVRVCVGGGASPQR